MELSNVMQIIGIAALPIIETRGAVPFAMLKGIPVFYAVLFSALGSLLPVMPLYYVFSPLGRRIKNFPVIRTAFDVLERNARKKKAALERWEALGLFLFVAVPLPMTGVWTGTVAAAIIGIDMQYALLSIALGSVVSGIIVALITNGVLSL